MGENKVIIVGLDGATWNLIKPWVSQGKLPTFNMLLSRGVWGTLKSPFPVTVPSWICYSTGKNPGKFGVFYWIKFDKGSGSIRTINYLDIKASELWDYLNKYGIKTGIINLPYTYPPKKVKGFMISGLLASEESDYTYPRSLKNELEKIGYKLHPRGIVNNLATSRHKISYVEDVIKLIKLRFKIALQLIEDVDFLHLTIFYIDYLQHFLWGEPELEIAWKVIDLELGKFIKELNRRGYKYTLITMSDHGFTPVRSKLGFYLNNFLEYIGFLTSNCNLLTRAMYATGVTFEAMARVVTHLGLQEFIRKRFRHIARMFPTKDAQVVDEGLSNVIDLTTTKALSLSGVIGEIYVLDESHREDVITRISSALQKVLDSKTREKVVNNIKRKEDIMSGAYLKEAPDLLVYPNEGYVIGLYNLAGNIFHPTVWRATHTTNGIFVFYGAHVRHNNALIPSVYIYDLAPTVLALFGVPPPSDMDGRILWEIIDIPKELKEHMYIRRNIEERARLAKVKLMRLFNNE